MVTHGDESSANITMGSINEQPNGCGDRLEAEKRVSANCCALEQVEPPKITNKSSDNIDEQQAHSNVSPSGPLYEIKLDETSCREVTMDKRESVDQKRTKIEGLVTDGEKTSNISKDLKACKCSIDLIKQANGSGSPLRKESTQSNTRAPGKLRHIVALLALSSIVLANTNRQAFNQALSRMVRPRRDVPISTLAPISNTINTDGYVDRTAFSSEPLTEQVVKGYTESPYDTNESADLVETSSGTSMKDELTSTDGDTPSTSEQPLDDIVDIVADDDLYDWDGKQVSILQGAFSYGYMPFMIPGGRLSEIYGAKWVIFLSGFGSALCSLMTPFLANYSFSLLVALRVSMGICQTGVSPALYALLTRWLAPDESSVYLAMIKVGVMIGFMSGSLINGFLPWRMTFYTVGFISLLWSVMWAICVTSNPEEHKFIQEKELAYIQHSLGRKMSMASIATKKKKRSKKGDSAPWLKIITNPVVLVFMYTKFTVKLSTDTQSMQLPMYLKNVLKVSDKLNGPLNAVNFAIQAVFTGLVAWTAKEMVVRKSFGLSKTGVRRIFQGINNFGMASGYLLISISMGSLELACCAVILISISSMFGSGGEAVIPVDLTTEYSASIMAIANSVANLSGIVLPPMVSFLLNNNLTDPVRWNHVWYCIASLMISGGLMFSFFAKAKLQNFEKKPVDQEESVDGDSRKKIEMPVTVIEMHSIERKI